MFLLSPPAVREAEVFTRMPAKFRRPDIQTKWAHADRGEQAIDSFLEGPVWCPDDRGYGHLYVTNIPHGRVFHISMMGGRELVIEYDGEPNDMKFVDDAHLLITDYRNGLMLLDIRRDEVTPYFERRDSEHFKGANDLTFDSHGNLYFTDQGQTGLQDPTGRVYRLSPEGRLGILLGNCPSPNGLVLSPDEKVLYIVMTRDNYVQRVPLQAGGSVSKAGQFLTSYGPNGPDGLTINTAGQLFAANPGFGHTWVLNHRAESGMILTNPKGASLTNLCFGGPETKTLFMAESVFGTVLKIEMDVAGPLPHRAKQSKVTPWPQLVDTRP